MECTFLITVVQILDRNMALHDQRCIPCEGGAQPLSKEEVQKLSAQIHDWVVSETSASITKEFMFANFAEALAFVNQVGKVAEQEGHHPDIEFGWGRVKVILATHSIGGLSINDFVLASKIDHLPK